MSGIFSDAAVLRSPPAPTYGADDVVETSSPPPSPPREEVPLTAVEPEGPARGGIIVLHESREFPESLLDLLRALALEGWLAAAPNLFHRGHGDEREVFGDDLFEDVDATFDWLVARGVYEDSIGVIGFDDAGTAAMIVATSRPVGAAVSVAAAGILEPLNSDAMPLLEAAPSLQAPWLGLYSEDDPRTPPEHVESLREALAHATVATNVVSYSGVGHRADNPRDARAGGSEHEDPTTAALVEAQTRIFDWFDSFLR